MDHGLLINRLSSRLSFGGIPIEKICSYLTNRTQFVSVGDSKSESLNLTRGVPQGSVLGPIFITIYTQPPGDILHQHNNFTSMPMTHNCIWPLMVPMLSPSSQLYLKLRDASWRSKTGCITTNWNSMEIRLYSFISNPWKETALLLPYLPSLFEKT